MGKFRVKRMASSRKPILLKALWHETKQSLGIWAFACHLQLAPSRFSPRASLKSPQCFPNIPTVFQTVSTILWVPLNRYKQNCSWEVQSLLILVSHAQSISLGGAEITEEWAFKGLKAPWLRNPSSPKCPIQNRCCPVCSARSRWKVWGAQHVLACTARQGLSILYAWPLSRWQHPPTPVSTLGTSSSSEQLACAQTQLDLTMILASVENREKNERILPTTYCRFFPISL